MATTENVTPTPSKPKRTAAKPKRKPAAASKASATAAKAPATAAASSSTQPQTPVERAQRIAEQALLIPVGAALEARDRVAGTVGELVATTRSPQQLRKRLDGFERRGGRARSELEREVRRTRTRLERVPRDARRGLDRQRTQARERLGANVDGLSGRVENVVQNGVNAGMKLVNGAQDRLSKVA